MKILRDYSFAEDADRGASVAIGNFDGVHLGHQAVLDIARKGAEARGCQFGVLTFEPHPREVFQPDAPPFRLMNSEARANRLDRLGVDILYELGFTPALSSLTAEGFARDVLHEGLRLSHVVVGRDFQFGKGRSGTATDLEVFGANMGFDVTIADLLETGGVEVSSTRIRAALSEGRPADAATMLGHWHRIEGEVIRGDQRGRLLGYPTTNMSTAGLHPPKFGVYAVIADVLTGPHAGSYHAVASIGVRPMFGENLPNLETFLFDFSGDLYGEHLSIALVEFLRPEMKFDGVDALVAQMDRDSDQARAILAALEE